MLPQKAQRGKIGLYCCFVAFAGGSAGNALGNIVANNVSTGAGFVLGTAFGS